MPMLLANPAGRTASGNRSIQTAISGPGDSLYGASAPIASDHDRLRNSALPPTPSDNASGPAPADSPSGSAAGRGLAAFGGGADGFAASSSSAAFGGAGFSS